MASNPSAYSLSKGKQKAEPKRSEFEDAFSEWTSTPVPDLPVANYLTAAQYLNTAHYAGSSRSSVLESDGRETPQSGSQPGTPLEGSSRPPRNYGKSLMDSIEERKAELKAKQRLVLATMPLQSAQPIRLGPSRETTDAR
jgi:hypothetical protein